VRLFVAVEIPADVRDALVLELDHVRPTAPAGLRWADPSRWHLTLAFFGEVADGTVDDLGTRLARAVARHGTPVLRVDGAGRFDGRVLWAKVAEEPPDGSAPTTLTRIAASVGAAARRAGIAQEERAYRPHVTLARAAATVDLRPLVDSLAGLSSRTWAAQEVLLVRSRLGARPAHTTLRSFHT
jgi:2'-5' RNA ligase